MEKMQEKVLMSDLEKNVDRSGLNCHVIDLIEKSVENGDHRTAFRLFKNNIIKLLCDERILDVCGTYHRKNEKIKVNKVVGEIVGVYEYYYAGNGGFRSFRPHGESFQCGKPTATFMAAVKDFLKLLADEPEREPWEIYCSHMDGEYYDLENYLDQAGVYAFPHNRRSREITSGALARYTEKYYGHISGEEFIELYQKLDRLYTTYGFPFACTHAGWFFEGYDVLYRRILDEGAWSLHDFWEQEKPSDWLEKQMEPYGIHPSYSALVEALQKPEYESLLYRLFPFRLTQDTLRPGCGMDSDEWEVFTLKLAKVLHFAECCNGRKNVPEDIVLDAVKAMTETLKTVRSYMD